ncbi:polysaccharide pyruvyl transferase family protein, partial [Candidatus Pacearchaeota archaeon]|nr:polysaccharide pyruvyl transferase family protein [Candidatus Pacearchaeota archaeon]
KELVPVVCDNKNVFNLFKTEKGNGSFVLRLIIQFILGKLGFKLSINKGAKELIDFIKDVNIVCLSPGGPYIGDMYDFRSEFIRLLVIFIAQKYKKKTMIYGPSSGPFKNPIRNFFRKNILKKVDVFIARDKQSYDYLSDLNLKDNIFLSTDCVFTRQINYSDDNKSIIMSKGFNQEDKIIGITPMDLSWHSVWGRNQGVNSNLCNVIARVADTLIEKYSYKILFIPQLFGTSDDMKSIDKTREYMIYKKESSVLDKLLDSDTQQLIFSKLYFMIGCRHHSVVLATKMKTPAISIAYEFKIISYMKEIGLNKYVIPIDNLNYDILLNTCNTLIINKHEYNRILDQQIPKLEMLASVYANKIKELYEKNSN